MAITGALKTKLAVDIERMKAECMSLHGYPLENILVLCPLEDVQEVQMLLDELYPENDYRAEAIA